MNTFKERNIELVKVNIWLAIMLSIATVIFIFPLAKGLMLGVLIGPVNLLFKMNLDSHSNQLNKWIFMIIFVITISLILSIWLFDGGLFGIQEVYLVRAVSLCLFIMIVSQYFDKFGKIQKS